MKDKLEDIEKKDEKKSQSFWSKIFQKEKLKKPEDVAALYLRENGVAEPMIVHPDEKSGFFHINNRQYHPRRDCKFIIGKDKTPLVIIPEWKLTPVGTKEYDDLPIEQRLSDLQQHTIEAIRHAEIVKMSGEDGIKPNWKVIIGIVIGGIILLAILKNYI